MLHACVLASVCCLLLPVSLTGTLSSMCQASEGCVLAMPRVVLLQGVVMLHRSSWSLRLLHLRVGQAHLETWLHMLRLPGNRQHQAVFILRYASGAKPTSHHVVRQSAGMRNSLLCAMLVHGSILNCMHPDSNRTLSCFCAPMHLVTSLSACLEHAKLG